MKLASKLLMAAGAVVVVVVSSWVALRLSGEGAAQGFAGRWETVVAQSPTNELVFVGKVLPVQMVEVSSPAQGVLSSLAVTWGDMVEKGQALGSIESHELAAQVRAAQIAYIRSQVQDGPVLSGEEPLDVVNAQRRLLSAQTALQTAKTRQRESSSLYEKGFTSRNDEEAAKADVVNAEQQVLQAQEELKTTSRKYAPDQLQAMRLEMENKRAELEQLRDRFSQLKLTAPLAGAVIYPQEARGERQTRELAVGARVTAGDLILAIGDTSSFLVRGYCSEADFAWLEVGASAEVTLASLPYQPLAGRVTKLQGQARARRDARPGEDSAYEFLVAFPSADTPDAHDLRRRIRIGSTAKVKIAQVSKKLQASIPLAAVSWGADGAAQVRWRAKPGDVPAVKPIRIARAGVADVLLHDELVGEVWVPGDATAQNPRTSTLKRLFGLDE